MAAFVTLDQYTAITGITTGIGEQVEAALEAACAEIQSQLSQTLALVEDDVVVLGGTGRQSLLLPQLPVVAVTDVTIDKDLTSELVVDPAEYAVAFGGILYRRKGWPAGWANITVTYTHGYSEIPMDIVNVAVQSARIGMSSDDPTLTGETVAGYSYTRSSAANAVSVYRDVLSRHALPRIPVA